MFHWNGEPPQPKKKLPPSVIAAAKQEIMRSQPRPRVPANQNIDLAQMMPRGVC